MARNVLAFGDIFNSSGEQLSPEEFVVILSGSQIKMILAFLESYSLWQSSWTYPSREQWDVVDAFVAEIYFRLGGESVYQISEKLENINVTLQEIRDKIGSGDGDGSGNTIQDLIFWLKILFAVAGGGGGLAPTTTTPLLAQIRDEGEITNTKLENQITQFEAMVEKLQGLIDKQCPVPVQSVRLDNGVLSQSSNLLRNGMWSEGQNNGISGAFYPHYWLVVGDAGNFEYPGRETLGSSYALTITEENNCIVRQTAIIPPGYELPKIIVSLPDGYDMGGAKINVYVNNSLVSQSIVESTATYYEADFNAEAGDGVKIELTAEGSSAMFGVIELLVWPASLPITNVVQLPTIGGSMGKGRKIKVQPDKKRWEVIDSVGNALTNWVVDKIHATADWLSLRLLTDNSGDQELQIAQDFNLDASVNFCHVNFTMSGYNQVARIELFNDGIWEYFRDCAGSGDFSVTVPLGHVSGDDKRLRMYVSIYQPIGEIPFDLYNIELELVD